MPRKSLPMVAVLAAAGLLGSCARERPDTSAGLRRQSESPPPPPPATLPAGGVIDPALAGDYYTGDGLGYNLRLWLHPDGTFACKWTGCLGDYGDARGAWSRSADRVNFATTHATGMLENHLRGATVVDGGTSPALVPDDWADFYRKHGLSRFSAFQRTSLVAK